MCPGCNDTDVPVGGFPSAAACQPKTGAPVQPFPGAPRGHRLTTLLPEPGITWVSGTGICLSSEQSTRVDSIKLVLKKMFDFSFEWWRYNFARHTVLLLPLHRCSGSCLQQLRFGPPLKAPLAPGIYGKNGAFPWPTVYSPHI